MADVKLDAHSRSTDFQENMETAAQIISLERPYLIRDAKKRKKKYEESYEALPKRDKKPVKIPMLKHNYREKLLGPFKCEEEGCKSKYSYKKGLRQHMVSKHKKKAAWPTMKTILCTKRTNGKGSFICSHCGKLFRSPQCWKMHMVNHSSSNSKKEKFGNKVGKTILNSVKRPQLNSKKLEPVRTTQPKSLKTTLPVSGCFIRKDCGKLCVVKKPSMDFYRHKFLPFKCQKHGCKASYTHAWSLRKHDRTKHTQNMNQVQNTSAESREMSKSADICKEFKCTECHKSFTNSVILKLHRRCHVGPKPKQRHRLTRHRTQKGPFTCTQCEKVLRSQKVWEIHLLDHIISSGLHTTEKVENELSPSKVSEQTGNFVRPKKRKHCVRSKKTKNSVGHRLSQQKKVELPKLNRLTSKTTSKKGYNCKECFKKFDSEKALEMHSNYHTGSRPFKCTKPGCVAAYAHIGALYNHTHIAHKARHTTEQLDIKECTTKTVIEGTSSEMLYNCPECDKVFSTAKNLKMHSSAHKGSKPFKCNVEGCDARYSHITTLINHKRLLHTEKLRFKCRQCNCRYQNQVSLRGHMQRFHGGSKSGNDSDYHPRTSTPAVKITYATRLHQRKLQDSVRMLCAIRDVKSELKRARQEPDDEGDCRTMDMKQEPQDDTSSAELGGKQERHYSTRAAKLGIKQKLNYAQPYKSSTTQESCDGVQRGRSGIKKPNGVHTETLGIKQECHDSIETNNSSMQQECHDGEDSSKMDIKQELDDDRQAQNSTVLNQKLKMHQNPHQVSPKRMEAAKKNENVEKKSRPFKSKEWPFKCMEYGCDSTYEYVICLWNHVASAHKTTLKHQAAINIKQESEPKYSCTDTEIGEDSESGLDPLPPEKQPKYPNRHKTESRVVPLPPAKRPKYPNRQKIESELVPEPLEKLPKYENHQKTESDLDSLSPEKQKKYPNCQKPESNLGPLSLQMQPQHANSKKDSKPYKCSEDQCEAKFSYGGTLMNHMRFVHGKRATFNCKHCQARFRIRASLRGHTFRCHTSKEEACLPRPLAETPVSTDIACSTKVNKDPFQKSENGTEEKTAFKSEQKYNGIDESINLKAVNEPENAMLPRVQPADSCKVVQPCEREGRKELQTKSAFVQNRRRETFRYVCELCSAKFKLCAEYADHIAYHEKNETPSKNDNPSTPQKRATCEYLCGQCGNWFQDRKCLHKHLLIHAAYND